MALRAPPPSRSRGNETMISAMHSRPLLVLTAIAASMVAWFSVRMWAGDSAAVWQVSCLLGAWAPLGAAAVYLYVREVGDREDSVFAAWLVRAIGMHCTLAWLVGVSDWLRGPPTLTPPFNADLRAPLVLASFFPAFAVCVAAFQWLRSVRRRLASSTAPPSRTVEVAAGNAPYRGAGSLRVTERSPRSPVAPFAAALAGAGALWFSLTSALPAAAVLAASAVALGVASSLGPSALGPGVAALVGVAGVQAARALPLTASMATAVDHAFAWPWLAFAGLGLYLATLEVRLRLARA